MSWHNNTINNNRLLVPHFTRSSLPYKFGVEHLRNYSTDSIAMHKEVDISSRYFET